MSLIISNTLLADIIDLYDSGMYLALYTTNPTAADTGTEVTGGSYARQAITFGAPIGGTISNSSSVTFTDLPAASITHWGIRSASTGGDLVFADVFTPSIPAQAGDDLTIGVGDLTITVAGA